MAATWELDSIDLIDPVGREMRAEATRTDDGVSKTYRVNSFRMLATETPGDARDRLAVEFKALANADKSWGKPDMATLFPNATVAMKTALEALET